MSWRAGVFEFGGVNEGSVEDIAGDVRVTGVSGGDFLAKLPESFDDAENDRVV